jgi:hypothetical protein
VALKGRWNCRADRTGLANPGAGEIGARPDIMALKRGDVGKGEELTPGRPWKVFEKRRKLRLCGRSVKLLGGSKVVSWPSAARLFAYFCTLRARITVTTDMKKQGIPSSNGVPEYPNRRTLLDYESHHEDNIFNAPDRTTGITVKVICWIDRIKFEDDRDLSCRGEQREDAHWKQVILPPA